MAINDNTSYELTGAQVKDLANKIKGKAADNIFVGATSSAPGSKGLVPQPQAGDEAKFLSGAGTWVDMAGSYSTSETATPFTWVDGKTIYKQTYQVPSGPSSGTSTVYISVPSSIDQIINYEGFLASSILTVYIGTARANPGTSTGFWYERNNNQIALEAGTSDRSGFSGYVTIYYTKTS